MPRIKPYYPPQENVKIAIVGEAPGAEEERWGRPFVGASGKLLTEMLHEARIIRSDCFITNVFLDRPPNNELANWCGKKKEVDEEWKALGNEGKYPYAGIGSGKYIRPRYLGELKRLEEELAAVQPNVIVALGATALWALTGFGGIMKNRGTVVEVSLSNQTRPFKVIPTFHPSYVLRKWDSRSIVVADLMKVKMESAFPEIIRPRRELWLEPTLKDMEVFWQDHLAGARHIAWDIETIPQAGILTCIGFGTTTHAICVPFFDARKENGSYWETQAEELQAWQMVRCWLESAKTKITQNGMYDMQWCWRKHSLVVGGELHDTQLLHHSMYPEMKKDLGTLGSLYTNEIAWKLLNPAHKTKGKKDD